MGQSAYSIAMKNMGELIDLANANKKYLPYPIYNVVGFGAKGDGVTDDTKAIQAAVDACSLTGGTVYYPAGTYLISRSIISKNLVPLDFSLPGAGVHFTDNREINHLSYGARIKAVAAMATMFTVTDNVDDVLIAPYYCSYYGLILDCNNLVSEAGIKFNNSFHGTVEKVRIFNANIGLSLTLSVVCQAIYNTIQATTCILVSGGGDCFIQHNDLFPLQNGFGVYMGGFSGNTSITDNIVSCAPETTVSGILLDGTSMWVGGTVAGVTGNIVIRGNEFSGTTYGIRAFGKPTHKTVYNVLITQNHLDATGADEYRFIDAEYVYDFAIKDNFVNAFANNDIAAFGTLRYCDMMTISGNKMRNTKVDVIDLLDCTDCQIYDNEFKNYGKIANSCAAVLIRGASVRNRIERNFFAQDSASYGIFGVNEIGTSDYNTALNNTFGANTLGYYITGTHSVMRRIEYFTAIPGTSSGYRVGDVAYSIAPASGGNVGWVLTAAGWKSFGTIA